MRSLGLAVALMLLSVPAFGRGRSAPAAEMKQVNVPVGSSTTVELPASVTKVTLSDPSVAEVDFNGRRLTITGQHKGSAEAMITTRDGKMRLGVYVASDKYALPYN
jgi:Flp pilus assembly secretin CpaC